jgi:hypothetical protein
MDTPQSSADALTGDAAVVLVSAFTFLSYYWFARRWAARATLARLQAHQPLSLPDAEAADGLAPPSPTPLPPPPLSSSSAPDPASAIAKSRSWLLSAAVAAFLTLTGLYYAAVLLSVAPSGSAAVYTWLSSEDDRSRAVTLVFCTFLVLDLSVGALDYRAQIDPLSGWVHHCAYLGILAYFMRTHCANSFAVMGICELPTLLLGLGAINPAWRSDLPMGLAFAATRICWFGALCGVTIANEPPLAPRPIFAYLVFALHAHWFRGWIRSYGKRRRALREAAAAGGAASSGGTVIAVAGGAGATPAPPPQLSAGAVV